MPSEQLKRAHASARLCRRDALPCLSLGPLAWGHVQRKGERPRDGMGRQRHPQLPAGSVCARACSRLCGCEEPTIWHLRTFSESHGHRKWSEVGTKGKAGRTTPETLSF